MLSNGLIRTVLFGNYFYGICAVALSAEAALQQQYPLNSFVYYIIVFSATVVYYTHAYIAEPATHTTLNARSLWYRAHAKSVRISQVVLTLVLLVAGGYLLRQLWQPILAMHWQEWLLLLVFPLVAALYYGSVKPGAATNSLRKQGWVKPFVIGFSWAGPVTLYPLLFTDLSIGEHYQLTLVGFLLFIKNFMYITLLCIMFDIKDFAADHNQQLKTFVVELGLRKTIFYILIPLAAVGLGTFLLYASIRQFPVLRVLINTLPFLLLIIVAYSLHRRKNILYYLAIIDGLMLVKAICGIIGISLIK
ncbi:UbiA prenyltransferase family protein [Sediminibacterium soli]|uniref:hypothetical protein n=1 Tax=Sediminibacterium soli TaxID=2698829 RepID=UPI00137B8F84|nr:hypothetical protein [Sediminibacterium soli]NCI46089.1 hypothetical protein [Sediminibacterium soli]